MALPKQPTLSGIEKVAILMNVLGEEKSFQLLKDMKDMDVRRLLTVMGQMKKAPLVIINTVLREFVYKISEQEEIIFEKNLSSPESVTKMLGEERAKHIFGRAKDTDFSKRKHLSALDEIDPRVLAEFLVREHPQTVALIVAHLDIPQQVKVVRLLPDSVRTEVILRMATLEYVSNEKIDELNEILRKELGIVGKALMGQLAGVSAVADLINSMDTKTMNSILTRLEDKDPLVAEEIRQHIFTFTDITRIDDRSIQLILREVPSDKLLLALKSSPEELREKIFGSMSERASQLLKEDLEALGPQKVSEVETAQREIIKIVKRLEEEGKIVIGVNDYDVVA